MRDYVEGIDGRYGDPDGLLGWLGERADSAGQGLLSGAARILGVPGAGTAMDFLSTMENAAQQARENGAGEDEAFLYGLGEVVKRIGGQQLEEYFRSKAGELFTRGEVQAMSPREISENYDAIRESMSLWDKDGRLPEDEQGSRTRQPGRMNKCSRMRRSLKTPGKLCMMKLTKAFWPQAMRTGRT